MIFNPFENRLCRDIRNQVGQSFIASLNQQTALPFENALSLFEPHLGTNGIKEYIRYRQDCLATLLQDLKTSGYQKDQEQIKIFLWNHQLFFEFHELIEEEWSTATGNNKKALQALILAAIVYEHLSYQRQAPAHKTARKALALFENFRSFLPSFIKPDLFIAKLQRPDPDPPKL